MAKQILLGIREQNLNEVAHYLMVYFPYDEEIVVIPMHGWGNYTKTNTHWFLKECGRG